MAVPKGLAAGRSATSLPFSLTLPQRADRISQSGTALRLGSFFPVLPWEPGQGWALEPPTRQTGETSASPIADFDVPVHAPGGLGWWPPAAGGPGPLAARDVRDFGVSAGDFRLVRRVVDVPGRSADRGRAQRGVAGQQAADEAQGAIEHLSRLYGRYPWQTLTLAYGPDLNEEGIEYPTILFEGPDRRA